MYKFNEIEKYDLSGFDSEKEIEKFKYDESGNIIYHETKDCIVHTYLSDDNLHVETRTVQKNKPNEVIVRQEKYKKIGDTKLMLSYRRDINKSVDDSNVTGVKGEEGLCDAQESYSSVFEYNDVGKLTQHSTFGKHNRLYDTIANEYDYIMKYDDKNRVIQLLPTTDKYKSEAYTKEYDDENNTETTFDYMGRITREIMLKDGNVVYEKNVVYYTDEEEVTEKIDNYDSQNRKIQSLYIVNGVQESYETMKYIDGFVLIDRYYDKCNKHTVFVRELDKILVSVYSNEKDLSVMRDVKVETDEETGIVTRTLYSTDTRPDKIILSYENVNKFKSAYFGNLFNIENIWKRNKAGQLIYRCMYNPGGGKTEDFYEYDDRNNLIRAHVPYIGFDMYYKFDEFNREIYMRSYEGDNVSSTKNNEYDYNSYVAEEKFTTYSKFDKTITTIRYYNKKKEA